MFVLNDDLSIYATRGDIVFFSVAAQDNGVSHKFQAGDVVRIKVFGKKDAENVVLQKDFPVTEETESVEILLTKEDTKIGEVISKPKDYWYEVELNPHNHPQTVIGYDEDGAKVFKLFPEGDDIPEFVPDPEDIATMDDELDMTSTRPVENQAIARAMVSLRADFDKTKEDITIKSNYTAQKVAEADKAIVVERSRIDNIVSGATADDAEVVDIRVGADGTNYESAGTAVRTQFSDVFGSLGKWIRSITVPAGVVGNGIDITGQFPVGETYYISLIDAGVTDFNVFSVFGYTDETNYEWVADISTVGEVHKFTIQNNYIKLRMYMTLGETKETDTAVQFSFGKADWSILGEVLKNWVSLDELGASVGKYTRHEITVPVGTTGTALDLKNRVYNKGDTVAVVLDEIKASNFLRIDAFGFYEDETWEIIGEPITEEGSLFCVVLPNDYAYIRLYVHLDGNAEEGTSCVVRFAMLDNETAIWSLIDKKSAEAAQKAVINLAPEDKLGILILGTSYSAGKQWVKGMVNQLQRVTDVEVVNLGVSSASVRDRYKDHSAYPYTPRPISSDNEGNHNTLACQVAKLKRLMGGTDLDEGESPVYQGTSPNIIIIEGGMNDWIDSDEAVANYGLQFTKKVDNVWVKNPSGEVYKGSCYVKTPIEEVDRTTFAGAYRYLCEELQTMFPDAQVFFTTVSRLGYSHMYDINGTRNAQAEQQRKCAELCGVSVIDWCAEGQISTVTSYPTGSGTETDPYTILANQPDTYDGMHPTERGGKKYGRLAAQVILNRFMNIGN